MSSLSPLDPGWEPGCPTARQFVAPRVRDRVSPSPDVADDRFRQWTPESQQRALDLIHFRQAVPWRPFYCLDALCSGEPHAISGAWSWPHARADQRPPNFAEDWLVWLLSGGRGGGKTRSGAELIHRIANRVPRIALIAPTGPDLRDTMVEGVSGLQVTAAPDKIPLWEPSKKRLTWPNGAIAQGFSGEEPDRLRGPQFGFAWIDEPAHMPLIEDVWDNLLFGLRLGQHPRIVGTTTPKPTKWMKALVKDPSTRISRFSTYANLGNLAETFKKTVLDRYEGTRLGRQELHGEILEDVEGALWAAEWFAYVTLDELPHFDRMVVAVDPAGTANARSDETGIIVLGISGKAIYVIEDLTGKHSPSGWATASVRAYEKYSADAIVAEKNYGGDMVKEVLEKNGAENIRIKLVTSRRGKAIRAEPIAALYEKAFTDETRETKVFHVRGRTQDLEDEQTTWVSGEGDSPNRLDALVHGATDLAKISMPAQVGSPASLRRPGTRRAS